MEEAVLVLILVAFSLAVPLAALILALVALVRTRRLRRSLASLAEAFAATQRGLANLSAQPEMRAETTAAPADESARDVAATPSYRADQTADELDPEPLSQPITGDSPVPLREGASSVPKGEPDAMPLDIVFPADVVAPIERSFPADATASSTSSSSLPSSSDAASTLAEDAPARSGSGVAGEGSGADRHQLERQLGTRLPLWIGASAIALAGVFLVHYSIQNNLVTPTMRVVSAICAALVCLGLGEWFTRKNEGIAHALSAAGIAVLFAAFVSATSLYHLLAPVVGFGLIALTTVAAVALSLRRGIMVALIGLLGGFVTPALVGSDALSLPLLFAFFLALQVGIGWVIRRKGWWLLAGLASGASLLWALLWIIGGNLDGKVATLGVFLVASAGVMVFMARGQGKDRALITTGGIPTYLALITGIGSTLLLALLVQHGGFGLEHWVFLGLIATGTLVLGCFDPRYRVLPWVPLGTSLVLLVSWHEAGIVPEELTRFVVTLLCSGALFVLFGLLAQLRVQRPGLWASFAVAALLAHFLVAWGCLRIQLNGGAWAGIALLLALITVVAALPQLRTRRGEAQHEQALAALMVGASALLALAVPLQLERAFISVAWALEAALLAWLAGKIRVKALGKISAALSVAVLIRLLFNPMLAHYPLGAHPLLNWISYGYALPAFALAVAAWFFVQQKQARLASLNEIGAVALGWAFFSLSVRHYFSPQSLFKDLHDYAEFGTYSVLWLGYGALLFLFAKRIDRPSLLRLGQGVFFLALAFTVLMTGGLANPLWAPLRVGSLPLLNAVLFSLGIPALFALHGMRGPAHGHKQLMLCSGFAALWLSFLTVSLELRQFFHLSRLDRGTTSLTELYAYSAVWVVFGTVLLIVGIWRRSTLLRFASLAVMLVAVGKVFLFDFSHLGGLYRVFSFLGLGVSLLVLAFLYQRFVFRETGS